MSRRRVILPLPDVIPANERDPQLLEKIAGELLQAQQSSGEVLEIKRSADPLVDFCGYLTPLST